LQQTALSGLVASAAERYPDWPALVDSASTCVVSYRELMQKARSVAGWLRMRGAGRGTCFAVHGPNSAEGVIAALGTMIAGGAFTGASPLVTVDELRRLLNLTRPQFLLTTAPLLPVAREAASRADATELIVVDEKADGAIAFSELLGRAAPADELTIALDTVAMLPFSSGTSGLPKAVELTHGALAAAALQIRTVLKMQPDDRLPAIAPMFHLMGTLFCICGALTAGASVLLVPRYEPEKLIGIVAQHGVTVMAVAPPVMQMLADDPAIAKHDIRRLRLIACGGAATASEVQQAVARRLRTTVVQGYGMTETSGVTACNPPQAPRPETCGRLFPLTEARVIDPDTGTDRKVGGIGEICVRGPQIMRGYWGNPEASSAAFTADGWLRSGDLGFFDEDGFLRLVSRLKELIKVNSYQVAPTELELLIAGHPAVADVAVAGRPHEKTGEIPVAFVVPRSPFEPADLIEWVAKRVASYKKIGAVEFVERIPRSPAGKILRRMLPATTRT
jgi:acyl-CoA synthetase (AMP-forming)/AMP-acid ligase II